MHRIKSTTATHLSRSWYTAATISNFLSPTPWYVALSPYVSPPNHWCTSLSDLPSLLRARQEVEWRLRVMRDERGSFVPVLAWSATFARDMVRATLRWAGASRESSVVRTTTARRKPKSGWALLSRCFVLYQHTGVLSRRRLRPGPGLASVRALLDHRHHHTYHHLLMSWEKTKDRGTMIPRGGFFPLFSLTLSAAAPPVPPRTEFESRSRQRPRRSRPPRPRPARP